MGEVSNNTIILVLGIFALIILLGAVITATLKHALIQQLESKNNELKSVIDENTKNISQKAKLLREKEDAFNEVKRSLTDLSERNTALNQDYRQLNSKYEKTRTNYEESQKDYLKALQSISDNQQEMDRKMAQIESDFNAQSEKLASDAEKEVQSFKANYQAEFEHLKKSHKRLVSANQTLSKNADNLREERDFYRTEFETLRDFLHDAQMSNVREIVAAKEKELAEKVISFKKNNN